MPPNVPKINQILTILNALAFVQKPLKAASVNTAEISRGTTIQLQLTAPAANARLGYGTKVAVAVQPILAQKIKNGMEQGAFANWPMQIATMVGRVTWILQPAHVLNAKEHKHGSTALASVDSCLKKRHQTTITTQSIASAKEEALTIVNLTLAIARLANILLPMNAFATCQTRSANSLMVDRSRGTLTHKAVIAARNAKEI
jgi:hypothetical protein